MDNIEDISDISDIESTNNSDNSDDILDTSNTEDENNTEDIMDIEDADNIENSENIKVANTINTITKMQSSYDPITVSNKKNKTSPIWNYIEEQKIENQVVARICKVEGCETIYSATTSTGILNKHLKNKHNIILNLKTNCLYLSQELYDKNDIKHKQECFNATVDLIIGAQLPFSFINNYWFCKAVNIYDPRYKIKEKLNKICEEMNIIGKNTFGFHHHRCAAHVLNIAIKNGIEFQDLVIVKVRKFINRIQKSTILCDRLRDFCSITKKNYSTLIIDIVTHWNSTYYMLNRFKNLHNELNLLKTAYPELDNNYPDEEE
ncbi:11077_t:CDS:2 [Cetraspora pellucida]|uniref:11077_t:CDS:1 n=1 Tax=Cetraspora pellucida TaxID=1433469 RepID=A0ACA9MJS3_9GLOM|nr:11077_t:CDS:2 [Cetraspora pellucida]